MILIQKINNVNGFNLIFGEVKDWESLCLLQAVYRAPIATDPGRGTPLCASDGVLFHCPWRPAAQAALIVSHLSETAAPERLKSKAFLLQTELGPSVSESLENFWTWSYEFILHVAAISSTVRPRKVLLRYRVLLWVACKTPQFSWSIEVQLFIPLSKKSFILTLPYLLLAQDLMSLKV